MKKTITGFIGFCSLVALVACGSDGDKPAEVGTLTSAASATTTEAPTSSGTSVASPQAPAQTPDGPAEAPADPGAGSALPRTYAQACSDVLTYLDAYQPAIDESGEEMDMTRQSLAADLLASIQTYPEWSTLSADEQAEVTRGIDAAAAGSC